MLANDSLSPAPAGTLSRVALRQAALDLRTRQPNLRARDTAKALSVSEAELLASHTGDDVARLDGDFADLIRALPSLGEIMALTRNEHCVHEKYGRFDHVNIGPGAGIVLNHDIDLRLFMSHWQHGFAVTEEVRSGRRRSFQFFDLDGAAVHKVYLSDASDHAAYDAILARFRAEDQDKPLLTLPLAPRRRDLPDGEAPREALLAHWSQLKDTHDFFGMLQEFSVSRAQAMRLAEGRFSRALSPQAVRLLLEAAASAQTPIMCFVGNPGCIQIHTGPVTTIKPMGPWINVLDPRFNLHLREDAIAKAYAVEKPTRDGVVTSVELFDADGFCFAQFFGERKPGKPEIEAWRAIVRSLPNAETAKGVA